MASSNEEQLPSARSIKSSSGELEVLSPECSVYMTEVTVDELPPSHGKPITPSSSTTVIGVPRKASTQLVDESDHGTSDSDPPSPARVLRDAGVDIDLDALTPRGGAAPLELLSQFMSCVMRDEYQAAKLLCEKILEFEPDNETALEFMPVITERLQLDAELPSDESSDSTESSSDSVSSSDDESTDSDPEQHGSHRHCAYHHDNTLAS